VKESGRRAAAVLILSLAGSVAAAEPPASSASARRHAAEAISFSKRVEGERAVERARYSFVIGATRPFDEVYPRSVFEERVAREIGQERVLKKAFGLTVTGDLLAREFERIEASTRSPEQWLAIKKALGNDRRLIEQVFCRPLLVERALRAKFAFDQKIHEVPHQKAREAREALRADGAVEGSRPILASRRSEPAATTDELLGKAREEASLPRILSPPKEAVSNAPLPLDPEVRTVLE
jgi:hypothetical protein